jgi:hypothetical protein
MNKSSDLLAGIDIIYELAKEKDWSAEQTNSQIQSFIRDWKDRRNSDTLKRHD